MSNETEEIIHKREPVSSTQESGASTVGKIVAPQMLSSQAHLSKGNIDERKMAVLNPLTATALGYFHYRSKFHHHRFWGHQVQWELITSQAEKGRARNDALRMMDAATGSHVQQVANRPNVLERNFWNRDWKAKAMERGELVAEP